MTGGGIGERLRSVYFGSSLHRWRLSGTVPEGLSVEVADAWPGDADAGRGILEGVFQIDGQVLQFGADPWSDSTIKPHVRAGLHRFEWLRDLRDLGGDAARLRARDLLSSWLDQNTTWTPIAWRPDVLGARVAAWVGHEAFCVASADDAFRARWMDSLCRQVRHLNAVLGDAPDGIGDFEAIRGAVIAAAALDSGPEALDRLLDRIVDTLADEILPDGGHVSRSPVAQARILASLVDIRAAMRAAGRPDTLLLDEPIQRMTGVLRALRHGDGGMALFNGATEGGTFAIDTLLARTESKSKAILSASDSGFERLVSGRTVVIVDVGRPSAEARYAHRYTHAGTTAFEVSAGKERIFVNCGSPGDASDARWFDALRSTAAHTTYGIDGQSSTEFSPDGGVVERPVTVRAVRSEADGAIWLEIEHDGYERRFGLRHTRRLYLAAGGEDLRGEDLLKYTGAPGDRPTEGIARFHLHPRISASLVQDGSAVLLRTGSKAGWRFRASNGTLALEDSVYFGDRGQMQRTRQITVTTSLEQVRDEGSATVKWALRREERRPTSR